LSFRRILVGIDGSELALRAALAGVELAQASQAALALCYAIPPAPVFVDAAALTLAGYDRHAEAEGRRILDEARAQLPQAQPVEQRLRYGSAASALLDEAKAQQADLLIVGSHGRSGLQRFILGSVAMQVVAHAPIAVLVIR
jgi:nucleotide-binding universal stress UspA family protein